MSIDYNALLKQYRDNGVIIDVKNNDLSVKAPRESLSQEQIEFLKLHKEDIINSIRMNIKEIPLTDIQSAYYLGRMSGFEYGDVACQVYLEIDYDHLEIEKANAAINKVIQKHEMLRAVIQENGTQRILGEVPEYSIEYWAMPDENTDQPEKFQKIRKQHIQWSSTIGKWPFFKVGISKFADKSVLHLVMDFIIADWTSVWILIREFEKFYYDENNNEEKVTLTFGEYVRLESEFKASVKYKNDKKYWNERMQEFPECPKLPILNDNMKNTFTRKIFELDNESWEKFKKKALSYNCTPTVALLTTYAMCLSRWSETSKFGLNITMLNRMPLHEDVNKIIGDFTSVTLLETCTDCQKVFWENMKQIQSQLNSDLDHNSYSGVKVLRDIAKIRGQENAMYPFVFTGSIGLVDENGLKGKVGGYGISQTPQVFIDCQAMDSSAGLRVNWDIRDGIFRDDVINALFETFKRTVLALVSDESFWEKTETIQLPEYQKVGRKEANATDRELTYQPLHQTFFQNAQMKEMQVAVVDEHGYYTYGQVAQWSVALAKELKSKGVKKGDRIGILLNKGAGQVAAVMGILAAGAVYVPLDEKQPDNRIATILSKTGINVVITAKEFAYKKFDGIRIYCEEYAKGTDSTWDMKQIDAPDEDDIAYIIYTSGSTGTPKGVQISHKAANNTIQDINERFKICEKDKVLALSRLNFDLSVYDIFGILSVGGTIIFPEKEQYLNPKHWYELIHRHNITVWNTVPSLMLLLLEHLEHAGAETIEICKVFLSGDWVPVSTRKKLKRYNPNAELITLGGATEAAIWSNYHICKEEDDERTSIPYGYPLANQRFRVLNTQHQDCPDYVIGELYILGAGVSSGYYNDAELNAYSFSMDTEYDIPSYQTGDFGYYAENGEIIFCGRRDSQVKIRGHRIEIGEIENTLKKNPNIADCCVLTSNEEKQNMIAAVVPTNKISEEELHEYLEAYLPEYMIPTGFIFVEKIPLSENGKKNYRKIRELYKEKKVTSNSECKGQRSESPLEMKMCKRMGEHLGVVGVNAGANLYNHGADSLILARFISELVEELKEFYPDTVFKFDDLLRQVLSKPTIQALHEFIEEQNKKNSESVGAAGISGQVDDTTELGNFTLYGNDEGDVARIVFHAGIGTMNFARYILPVLEQQKLGPVYGVVIRNMDRYCEVDAKEVIERLGKEYAKQIQKLGFKKVQLIGYCMGGLIASAVACNLLGTEVEIKSFLLVDSAPVLYDIGETIALELMFITNYFITVEDVYHEITNMELMEAIEYVFRCKQALNEEDFEILKVEEKHIKAYEFLQKLSAIPMEQRFKAYADTIGKRAQNEIPKEMLLSNYKVYVHSFQSSKHDAEPYFGDVHFLEAKEELAFIFTDKQETRNYWQERIFGNFVIDEIPGDHVTCIEDEENAIGVAQWAARELMENA